MRKHDQAVWDQSGVLRVGGRALCGPPRGARGARSAMRPYVGALPFPKVPIPAFPVSQGLSPIPVPTGPVQAQPKAPQGPSVPDLITSESQAVGVALAQELEGMKHTYGGQPNFAAAAAAWQKASEYAAGIASATYQTAPVTSKNAATRAGVYYARKITDEGVASGAQPHPVLSGKVQDPNYGWNWPPIPQDPEPIVPLNPGGAPGGSAPAPGQEAPPTTAAPGGSGALFAVGLGLLAVAGAVLYAGSRKKRAA